ncbi:hypothetical protein Ahy_B08g090237 [Arachis hypogaea]|uniref:Zinc finger GRF-type domain-containing protein n=1 Tax=Arachis hypogaea TaxID=3818 RepID=A0A444XZW8_ARAHY|nr:hypothetical protein Ahy_B08g090237 [Arachis hypogaea]
MMGRGNNHVSSSSNRRSERRYGWRTVRSNDERLPDRSGCGNRPVLKWSGTEANPGRPFYGCPNYNVSDFYLCIQLASLLIQFVTFLLHGHEMWLQSVGKRWCGLFMWANKVLDEEEVNDRDNRGFELEEWRMKLAWKIGSLEFEIKALKLAFCVLLVIVLVVIVIVVCVAWK